MTENSPLSGDVSKAPVAWDPVDRSSQYSASSSPLQTHASPRKRGSVFLEVGLSGEDAMVDQKLREESTHRLSAELSRNGSCSPNAFVQIAPLPAARRTSLSISRILIVSAAFLVLWLLFFYDSTEVFRKCFQSDQSQRAGGHHFSGSVHRLSRRDDSPTSVCKRWAHMSAVVNNTVYIYGGQATTNPDQTQNTWNNNFLSLDLSSTWQIGSPALKGLPQPSGPPAVALGSLWNSMDELYLYGGQYSWQPVTTPKAFSLWSYEIRSGTWTEHKSPRDVDGQPVEGAAEGAGVSVPALGRGFYLGGHLDGYTTLGWSQSTPRLYLESTLEFTMPGYTNAALSSRAGSDGAYRNVTTDSAGFPQRADGALVYVPGYGEAGIIVGIAGGTNDSFTQMNVLDVYDIATARWYKQAISGPTPKIRVNPCAVAMTAADGSSTQIYMYGGQNLQPAREQVQYDDMWILTIPSFTWMSVEQGGQSIPPARAGHTCHAWNGQVVVVGGYVGQELSCDSPGIYVFNTSAMSWQNQYTALDTDDPLNRQQSQRDDPGALQGSFGYAVPALVQSQIGGDAAGSATVTEPVQTPTQGPLVTGEAKTYTVTGNGGIATYTTRPGSAGGGQHKGTDSIRAGAIAAGVIAGILAVVAAYLGFCTWIYRRQLRIYKNHVAMARQSHLSYESALPFMAGASGSRYRDKDQNSADRHSSPYGREEAGAPLETTSSNRSHTERHSEVTNNNPYRGGGGAGADSSEDLMQGQEPSFVGVMLHPRRSLRVVNRD